MLQAGPMGMCIAHLTHETMFEQAYEHFLADAAVSRIRDVELNVFPDMDSIPLKSARILEPTVGDCSQETAHCWYR